MRIICAHAVGRDGTGIPELAMGSIRFGLGRFNTETDVREAIRQIVQAVSSRRSATPRKEVEEDAASCIVSSAQPTAVKGTTP